MNRRLRRNEDLRKIVRYCHVNNKRFSLKYFKNKGGQFVWLAEIENIRFLEIFDEKMLIALKRLAARL